MKLEDLCTDLVMLPDQHRQNGLLLLEALNPIEKIYIDEFGHEWHATNGYRFMSEHVKIYEKINARRKEEKKKPLAIPLGSQHLKFNAVDVYDPKQDVKFFISNHLDLFEEAGIYFEAFKFCPDWVHMQRVAPRSGNRFFIPF